MSLWLRSILLVLNVLVNGPRKVRTQDSANPNFDEFDDGTSSTNSATDISTTNWWASLTCRDPKAFKTGNECLCDPGFTPSFFESLTVGNETYPTDYYTTEPTICCRSSATTVVVQLDENKEPKCSCKPDFQPHFREIDDQFDRFLTCVKRESATRCVDFAELDSEENICKCKLGYEYKYDEETHTESCENINECENTEPACSNGRYCIDKDPTEDGMTHYCVCNPGETRPGMQNICEPCDTGHYCLNEEEFICPKGFFSDSRGSSACSYCGYGSGTESTGAKRMRDCSQQPYGFSAFLLETPKAY